MLSDSYKYLILGFVSLLILSGCGGGYSSGSTYTSPISTSTVREVDCTIVVPTGLVNIQSSFSPASETIAMNGVVKWTNNDSIIQTVTSGTPTAPDRLFDVSLAPNTSRCLRFTAVGTYNYYSRTLTTMTAQVVVQ